MGLNVMLSGAELAAVNREVDAFNKSLNAGKTAAAGGDMGKDEFLKILITQLSHQDPTQPMQDKEFIAQMAQFSSLEQITNMNREFKSLIKSSQTSEAYKLLGMRIESYDPIRQKVVSGVVSSIVFNNGEVRVKVGGEEVSLENIHSVSEMGKAPLTKE